MASMDSGTPITSATFSADALHSSANNAAPDQTILSVDDVLFFVHAAVIRRTSANSLAGLLAQATSFPIRVPEDSQILTIVLCKIYSLPLSEEYDWPTLARAVAAITRYGLCPLAPGEALYDALIVHVNRPDSAKDVFGLAAHHGQDPLAVAASAHLLPLDLSTIDDAWAIHIGPVYLLRLFSLHLDRVRALRRILSLPPPPPAHPATASCGPAERERDVVLPWDLAGAQLVANAQSYRIRWPAVSRYFADAAARPSDTSNSHDQIEAALSPIARRCSCVECSLAVAEHIQAVLLEWSTIKSTI